MCTLLLLLNRNVRRWSEGNPFSEGSVGTQVFREPGISMIKAETGEQSVAS